MRKYLLKKMISNLEFPKIYTEKILNGAVLAQNIQLAMSEKIKILKNNLKDYDVSLPPPKLKVILIGDKSDSKVYVENKMKMCDIIGIEKELKIFPEDVEKEVILDEIEKSNLDNKIHGIIVQLPLPNNLSPYRTEILTKVELKKDVDGLNPYNQGKILQMSMSECLLPPTAVGVIELLRLGIDYSNNIDSYTENYLKRHLFDDQPLNLSSYDVCIIGRGLTSGLPLSLLLQKFNGTVTLCHSKSKNIISKCENADILISAVGKKNLVSKVMKDSIVIDVGINVDYSNGKKKICGDVDFDSVVEQTKYITTVPGGVGRMTVIMLLKNVIKAWSILNEINLNNFKN